MNFLNFALSLLASPTTQPQAVEIPTGQAWCSGKLCDTYREFDVLPGHPASKLFGAIPSFAFCVVCGDQVSADLPEDTA